MSLTHPVPLFLGTIIGLGLLLASGPATAPPRAAARTVALTFDDIPLGQGQSGTRCSRDQLLAVSESMAVALVEARAPSAAFITTGNVCDQIRDPVLSEVIRVWERAGASIGNHGHRHVSLSRVPLEEYTADLTRADSLIRRASGQPAGSPFPSGEGGRGVRWFRHPFLHAGPDTAIANALTRWLQDHHYAIAPVTIDNNEWVYARAYTRALERGDTAMVRRLVPAYLEHIDQAFAFAESMSLRVTGEEVPQILLLHANELNRDHLREVLAVIRQRGYEFIPLEAALAHPAYQRTTHYVGPWGISWILRWSSDSTIWRLDLPGVPGWVEQ